ncbi:MAG: hypothetical protein IKG82_11845 [Oscillospiraceae bacterium]|nr:hypothetical protein [Oscillospiraceae bacterium]
MDVIDLINILFRNHSGEETDYEFFICLIKHLMRLPNTAKEQADEENSKYNPFDVGNVQQATVIRCIRRQTNHQLEKKKMQKVRKCFDIDRSAEFIKSAYTDQEKFNIEAEIRECISDFNEQEDDICYPCAYLMLRLIDEYIGIKDNTTDESEPVEVEPSNTTQPIFNQPVIFNFVQNGDHNTQIGHVEHYHTNDKED